MTLNSDAERFNEAAAMLSAIIQVLIDKGVVTDAEMSGRIVQARAMVDQYNAKQREEYLKTPEGQNVAVLAKLMGIEL